MKPIRLSKHALEQCLVRGATEMEVKKAILEGSRELAKHGRILCRFNYSFNNCW